MYVLVTFWLIMSLRVMRMVVIWVRLMIWTLANAAVEDDIADQLFELDNLCPDSVP